ncbi:MAG TPA: hypothetical protein VMM76_16120 [Pirellulaceae bacterium]|nr:hypothetical protein [Pirellulaceae bacterium]
MNHKITQLRELLNRKESEKKLYRSISSGCLPLDRALPQRGFQRGSLIEWIAGGVGSGASLLAMLAARSACGETSPLQSSASLQSNRTLVLVDRGQSFYPPAANACQLDLQNTIIVHPTSEKDECWALEQALRCPDVAAVVGWPQRLTSHAFRRLQLAAEHGGSLGLLIRPAAARHESSWASVRMLVLPCPLSPCAVSPCVGRPGWRLGIELLRCGGFFGTKPIELEIDDQTGEIRETHPRPLAAQLADTASDPRPARA